MIGVDRNQTIRQKSSPILPQQNVVAQANFVKQAFELIEGKQYPTKYLAWDIGRLSDLSLGQFDLILALCVVYHQLEKTPQLLKQLAAMTDHLILQTCLLHRRRLGQWANPHRLAKILKGVGFTKIKIDAPKDYHWPMVIGQR